LLVPFYEKGDVRIRYEEAGSGFPLFIIPGGGLNSCVADIFRVFDVTTEFKSEYRCITMDLRNAVDGESTGPLDVKSPWDSYTGDQLGLLDHLGVDRFLAIGFCIGNPLIWNLIKHAPQRVAAGVLAQPSGVSPGDSDYFIEVHIDSWIPKLLAKRPDLTRQDAEAYLHGMYDGAEFITTVNRDFVSKCQTPLLVLPDNIRPHPYEVAMEMVHLAPNAQVSLYPWKDNAQNLALAIRHIRTFLRANAM
jgi:pimeloyl-ACP methyl ester carboxylesterase